MNDFFNKYIQNSQGQILPEALWNKSPQEVNQQMGDFFQSGIMGATTAPTNSALMFAQKLANRGKYPYVSPDGFNSLMNIVKRNLNLPKRMTDHPQIDKLLQEVLGSAEKPRFNIPKITPK